MSDDDYDYLFKSVIVGDSNVGKTQILSRFIDNQFTLQSKPTIGVQFGTKTIKIDNSSVKNQIWDTAGQQRFRALTCAYYRGAVGAIVVFDLSKYSSFANIQKWIKEVKQYSQPNVTILLVGNKNDIQLHEVRQEDIQNFAIDHKLLYLSTSAATGQNVDLAFQTLLREIIKRSLGIENNNEQIIGFTVDNQENQDKKQNINKVQTLESKKQNNKRHEIKRQKPKIEAFSIEERKKIKIGQQKKQNQKIKKKCC